MQDVQPLRVLHLGGDEVPADALRKSPACRRLLQKYTGTRVNLRLHFIKLAVDIAARLGVETVQVTALSNSHCILCQIHTADAGLNQQEAQLLLGDRATPKHAKDS